MLFEHEPRRIDLVYVLLIKPHSNQILTVQDQNGLWKLPGGKKELGETLEQAAVREVKEKTGLDVTIDGMIHVQERHLFDQLLLFTFLGKIQGGKLKNGEDKNLQQVRWMTPNEVYEKIPGLRKQELRFPNHAQYQVM